MNNKPSGNGTHLAGEHFVAAELSRRGWEVSVTLANTKSVDLVAYRDGLRPVPVQVKAMRDRKNGGWPTRAEAIKDGVIYVFVIVNAPGSLPDYFICTPAEVRRHHQKYAVVALDIRTIKNLGFRERWDKIDAAAKEAK
jgi:hypothetical protein